MIKFMIVEWRDYPGLSRRTLLQGHMCPYKMEAEGAIFRHIEGSM